MALFGLASLLLAFFAFRSGAVTSDAAMILILLIVVMAILAQTVVLIKIYEQHQ